MAIRFVVDENIRAVGKALVEVRDDVTYFGDPGSVRRGRSPCPILLGTPDEQWLPVAGANDWSVITRDKHIRTRPGEIAAVKRHGVRLFAITSEAELNRWEILDVLVHRWKGIEREATAAGPAIFSVTATQVTRLVL